MNFVAVFATVCHLLGGVSLCHETKVTDSHQTPQLTMQSCMLTSQVAIAQWKANSMYEGDDWTVSRIECSNDPSRGERNST